MDLSCKAGNTIYAPFDGEISYYQPYGNEPGAECADEGIRIDGSGQWRGILNLKKFIFLLYIGYYTLISSIKLYRFGGKVKAGEELGTAGNLECHFSSRQASQNYIRVQLFKQGSPIDPTHHLIDCNFLIFSNSLNFYIFIFFY